MSKKINMATFGQLMILFGLIIAGVGGYVAYVYSSQGSDKKHNDLVKKGEELPVYIKRKIL